MATNISFDTPQSGSAYTVHTTGTVAAKSTAHVKISLNVTNTNSSHTRNDTFYEVIDIPNTLNTAINSYSTYATIAIVPKLLDTETVTVLPVEKSY